MSGKMVTRCFAECPGVVYRGKCAVRDRLPLGCDGAVGYSVPVPGDRLYYRG